MKKAQFRRVLSLLLAAILLCMTFVSCGDNPETPKESGTAGTNTETQPQETPTEQTTEAPRIRITENGEPAYRIIYPVLTNSYLSDAMDKLQNRVKGAIGKKLPSVADQLAAMSEKKPEIYLGETKFAESKEVLASLDGNRFAVMTKGEKIVVIATDNALYGLAMDYLLALAEEKDGTVSFPVNISFVSKNYASYDLVKDGKSDYTICYDPSSESAKLCAEDLQKTIMEVTGVQIPVKRDSAVTAGKNEILIGDTDRPLSAKNKAAYLNYIIGYDNASGSISLTGYLEAATAIMKKAINASGDTGSFAMSEMLIGETQPEGYGRIPAYKGHEYDALVRTDPKSYYVYYERMDEENFAEYTASLAAEKFTLYTGRNEGNNQFATYTDGETILTVNYISHQNLLKISAETTANATLPKLQSDAGPAVTTPQLTQVGGQCAFIIRLADGRFLIVDGGMPAQADLLYQTLCAQNVLGDKPVIAAWFLTHAHIDHFGCFRDFSAKYASKVELQHMVVNIPVYEIYSVNGDTDPNVNSDMKNTIATFFSRMENFFPDTSFVVPHTGQIYWFGDAKVEIFFTQEDLMPDGVRVTNATSMVFAVNVAGQRILFTGDAYENSCYFVYRAFTKSLKCDIVQIAHHGYNGGYGAMYDRVSADVAIWTNSLETIETNSLWNSPRNNFDMTSVQENLMMPSSEPVMVMPLPYRMGTLPKFVHNRDYFQK